MTFHETLDSDAAPSLEERFVGYVRAGRSEAACRLLEEELGDGLRRRLGPLALSLGGGDEADHLTNWAISVAVTKGAAFDPAKGRLAAWLHTLARNLAVSQQRRLRPAPGLRRTTEARARTVESRLQNKDAFLRIWKRIPSDIHRQVLFLDLKHGGQAPGGLAAELGLDRATFYKRRSEARRMFRELWYEEFGDPRSSFYGELE